MSATPDPGSPAAVAIDAAGTELRAGNLEAARAALLEALRHAPQHAAAHNLLGFVALRRGQRAEAAACFRRAADLEPENRIYTDNLRLAQSLQPERAPADAMRAALAVDPRQPDVWMALARTEARTRGTQAALAVFREALVECPDHVGLLHALANALHEMGRLAEAVIHYHHCLVLDPRAVDARIDLALACLRLLRLGEAERWAREAVDLAPQAGRAHVNLGSVLYQRRRFREAITCIERGLALQPDEARGHNQLGMACMALGDASAALAHFRTAVALKPDYAVGRSNLMLAMLYSDAVTGADIYREALAYRSARPMPASTPHANVREPERRLRVGFVSGDFRRHVVGMFLLPLFAHRDRARFEFFCYSAVDVPDPFTQILTGQSDGWIDIRALDDAALAARIRADRIDILFDLSGHTSDNRLPVFARRPAPVQATWLGFPGTTGAPGIDYRYTDAVLDPPGSETESSEAPVRLDRGYFCYAPLPDWGGALPVAELPARRTGRITFGAFNNLAKVSSTCLDLWAEAMHRTPQSRLVCRAKPFDDAAERVRFTEVFERRGIESARVEAIPYLPDPTQHLRIYDDIDIHLDTTPYSGGTTTCDALWMGAPVVTIAGDRPSARLGASVLTTLGLPELIATDGTGYVAIAVELARDIGRLAQLRAGLRARFTASFLHDAAGFAREFERVSRSLWRRWCKQPAP